LRCCCFFVGVPPAKPKVCDVGAGPPIGAACKGEEKPLTLALIPSPPVRARTAPQAPIGEVFPLVRVQVAADVIVFKPRPGMVLSELRAPCSCLLIFFA